AGQPEAAEARRAVHDGRGHGAGVALDGDVVHSWSPASREGCRSAVTRTRAGQWLSDRGSSLGGDQVGRAAAVLQLRQQLAARATGGRYLRARRLFAVRARRLFAVGPGQVGAKKRDRRADELAIAVGQGEAAVG